MKYGTRKEELKEKYEKRCDELIKSLSHDSRRIYLSIPEFDKSASYEEYCEISGKSLYRGYYHPNPLSYFTVGYWSRGKLKKKIPDSSIERRKQTFIYKYDTHKNRILIYEMYGDNPKSIEVLVKAGDVTHGYAYQGNVLYSYTRQIHKDGRPILLERIILQPYGHRQKRYVYEESVFEYGDGGIAKAVKTELNKYENGETSLVECVYEFEHDGDGFISLYRTKYPLEEYGNGESREFQPLKKVKF